MANFKLQMHRLNQKTLVILINVEPAYYSSNKSAIADLLLHGLLNKLKLSGKCSSFYDADNPYQLVLIHSNE